MSEEKFNFYKEHPKTCQADDFWGQVKRTVNGEPVSQEQIDMIVSAVVKGLDLNSSDTLLDLCCGNGALSTLLFEHCSGGQGVDFSECLIDIANKNFSNSTSQSYLLQDVVDYCTEAPDSNQFTKVVCYGSFPYLEYERAELMLSSLSQKFHKVERVFIGNCPNKDLISDFYYEREYTVGDERNPDSSIGIWRSPDEFISLAEGCGWLASIHRMPPEYYASHYRYDVVLSRKK